MGSSYPQFTCPNCRAVTDLEAELDVEDGEGWEENVEELVQQAGETASIVIQPASSLQNQDDTVHVGGAAQAYDEAGDIDLTTIQFESNAEQPATPPQAATNSLLSRRQTSNSSVSSGIAPVNSIHIPTSSSGTPLTHVVPHDPAGTLRAVTPTSADIIAAEGPLTPRNDAGPVVFDGSAGRSSSRRVTATAMDESE
jgi:E3 ubiquitin-protein ligase DMA1/2